MANRSRKSDVLYCGKFPADLKKRCEGMAGYLGQTITDFVAEILEAETKDVKGAHDAVKQWHEGRKRSGKVKT
jgi:hypothetical protein